MTCTHDPKIYAGMPMGMYHCPECGMVVLAGCEHPKNMTKKEVDAMFEDLQNKQKRVENYDNHTNFHK